MYYKALLPLRVELLIPDKQRWDHPTDEVGRAHDQKTHTYRTM